MEQVLSVLAVDDDPLIREIVKDALDEGGFTVFLATSGEEAVELLAANATNYVALVTDINFAGAGWRDGTSPGERGISIPPFRSST